MDTTPTLSLFEDIYKSRTAPWVIGEPQPAIVDLERAGLIGGRVLDVGCGTGEHTILLARLGYDVLGVDYAPRAIAQARENAAAQGVEARFEVADDDADRSRYVRSVHVLALSDLCAFTRAHRA